MTEFQKGQWLTCDALGSRELRFVSTQDRGGDNDPALIFDRERETGETDGFDREDFWWDEPGTDWEFRVVQEAKKSGARYTQDEWNDLVNGYESRIDQLNEVLDEIQDMLQEVLDKRPVQP